MSYTLEDLVIIGSGAAAMSAALYAGRDQIRPLVIEKANFGGTTAIISEIENYPGFSGTGAELMQLMRKQAEAAGARFEYGECTRLQLREDGIFELEIDGDSEELFFARAVIVATGTERRKLGIIGENSSRISYCATCDAPLCRDKELIVIGGGNSAAQEALYLLTFCKNITLLVRSDLRCEEKLKQALQAEPRIRIVRGFIPQTIEELAGGGIKISDENGQNYSADRIFVFIGSKPATEFLPANLLDSESCLRSDAGYAAEWPGLFVAGDCRSGARRQTVIAAGEGASAAIAAREYLTKL